MRRERIELGQVAAFENIADAARKAARGKRARPAGQAFFADLDASLNRLGRMIRAGEMPIGRFSRFTVHDPKPRIIHAACFTDRVFHHALMSLAGPVLDRALTDAVYACRTGKGNHAVADRVQALIRRYPWYVKIDIEHYFNAVDHQLLFELLCRKFKGGPFLDTLWRVIDAYCVTPGKGLPIGALTSQHFANYYLDGFDRFMQERQPTRAYVRYMDDCIWWCADKQTAGTTLAAARDYLASEWLLKVKTAPQINCSARGVTFCGFRVLPGAIRLTARKRRRYAERRAAWEQLFLAGAIDANQLQCAYASVYAITSRTQSLGWRREQLRRYPSIEA